MFLVLLIFCIWFMLYVALLALAVCLYYKNLPQPHPFWLRSGLIQIYPSAKTNAIDQMQYEAWTAELIAIWAHKFDCSTSIISETLNNTIVQIFDTSRIEAITNRGRIATRGVAWPTSKLVYMTGIPYDHISLRDYMSWLYKHEVSHIIIYDILHENDYEKHHTLMEEVGIIDVRYQQSDNKSTR